MEDFIEATTTSMRFGKDLDAVKAAYRRAQKTQQVPMIGMSKFYMALSIYAYEERERRGAASKKSGVKISPVGEAGGRVSEGRASPPMAVEWNGSGMSTSATLKQRNGGAVEGGEVPHDFEVKLEGEALRIMRGAMKIFAKIGFGLYSGLRSKDVAIDHGVVVRVTWTAGEE
ncbi:hypothetical protein TeGR_g5535 [Tetraparma gracilis]|uniref:Uncharacterized protein n=1 Tax=Tetraparma gracilis TaxID=2962635 RepID=A0ABQ6MUE0_9STRA|nr:hypothetical protein TeGR_g5535 [Tetraparma gracilis]